MSIRVEVTHAPARFGRYPVVRQIGSGGMARVFEARHPELDSPIALKVMREGLAAQPRAAARFLREARAAAKIRHQHVIQVFDVGAEAGVPYMAMEFLDGADLATVLRDQRVLLPERAVELILPVISAVEAAHAAGIIHRDLKPANVMLARRPPRPLHPVVLDFGISKLSTEEAEAPLTRSESLLGTLHYMAPELTKGGRFASRESDQYALGVMLYECVTGRRPFDGDSHYELMHSAVTAPLVPPHRLVADLDPAFSALILRAMSRDPSARFPSMRSLGNALLSFGAQHDVALWREEFWGAPAAVGERTEADVTPVGASNASEGADKRFPPALRSAQRLLTPALSAYGLATTALLCFSASRPPERTIVSHSMGEALSRNKAEIDEPPPTTEPSKPPPAVDAPPSASARRTEAPVTHASHANGAAGPRARTIRPLAPRAQPTMSDTASVKMEQPLRGANASLIID